MLVSAYIFLGRVVPLDPPRARSVGPGQRGLCHIEVEAELYEAEERKMFVSGAGGGPGAPAYQHRGHLMPDTDAEVYLASTAPCPRRSD